MKKILLLLFAILSIISASAQVPVEISAPVPQLNVPHQNITPKKTLTRSGNDSIELPMNYYINDFYADSFIGGLPPTTTYATDIISPLNSRYSAKDTGGIAGFRFWSYVVAGFTNFFYFDAGDTLIPIGTSSTSIITIDSIFFEAGWEQNSTFDDTTEISIVKLDSAGFPADTPAGSVTTLWDTLLIHSLGSTPNNSYTYQVSTPVSLSFQLPPKSTSFGIMLRYWGPTIDTFVFVYGHPINQYETCESNGARTSYFYPNAFGYRPCVNPTGESGLFPYYANGKVNDLYVMCHSGAPDSLDGANPVQDLDIGVDFKVTNYVPLGISKTNPDVSNAYIYPNPGKDYVSLSFTTPQACTNAVFTVYDITGNVIESSNLGNLYQGQHQHVINTSDFASGLYLYSISTSRGNAYGKFVKQ